MAKRDQAMAWLEQRLPIKAWWQRHATQYWVPRNLNVWYCFGVLLLVILVNQVLTGFFLLPHYIPTATHAFASIQHIMREVPMGWLLRYLHTTGASMLFIALYLHVFRGLLYSSYHAPRELVWCLGLVLYVMLLLEALVGYVLPWGQLSYWGAQVMSALLEAIPGIGHRLALWFQGDYKLSGASLRHCLALHIIAIPLLIAGLVRLHLVALRTVGGSNPTGADPVERVPFHPYYTVRDLLAIVIFLVVFCGIVFFAPTMAGYFVEPSNLLPADPLTTPELIHPMWYLAPYYAMLRVVPDKLGGIVLLLAAISVWFMLPWLDRSKNIVLSRRRPIAKLLLGMFVISFLGLSYPGLQPVTTLTNRLCLIFTIGYFGFFVGLPLVRSRGA